jgi:anti-anti-sigma regulatory factor
MQENEDAQIVSAFGELGLSNSGEIEELPNGRVSQAVEAAKSTDTTKEQEPERVIIDLSGITFTDVTGLWELVWASRELEDTAGRRLSVVRAAQAERVFELATVTEAVELHPNPASAVPPSSPGRTNSPKNSGTLG